MDPLKMTAYCAYLGAWLVFAIVAAVGTFRRGFAMKIGTSWPVLIGELLQILSAYAITRRIPSAPLHPTPVELVGALVLAPLGAVLFAWATGSLPRDISADTLVTRGAYSWLRHPIYLAFLAMLVATGFLVAGGVKLIVPVVLYLAGSELRIASEEADLNEKFPEGYALYRRQTRWRYLPGLR